MADLPEERLRPSKPFQFIGLDMIGPLNVKTHEKVKTWICIFTCLTTRAVHLEYVMNLSAPTFVQCLIRCFSRRGLPDQIISDNASQFVLASKAYIAAYPVEKLTWRFNVPLAPWQGGIFERLVAIVKNAFRRSIGRRCLGLEEFRTFICQVENTLNCRPITAVNNDIDSHNVLRPIDFLIPEFTDPSISIEDDRSDPEYLPPNVSSKVKLVKHWEKTLQHLHALWDFWTTDYLTLLRERMQSHHKGRRNQMKICRKLYGN
uniref:Integrase catalytic domain-containing protein n=1 Tax=Panagrolaimus superbus TaxID=310955 RepID=A0A914YPU2_9BILA